MQNYLEEDSGPSQHSDMLKQQNFHNTHFKYNRGSPNSPYCFKSSQFLMTDFSNRQWQKTELVRFAASQRVVPEVTYNMI